VSTLPHEKKSAAGTILPSTSRICLMAK